MQRNFSVSPLTPLARPAWLLEEAWPIGTIGPDVVCDDPDLVARTIRSWHRERVAPTIGS